MRTGPIIPMIWQYMGWLIFALNQHKFWNFWIPLKISIKIFTIKYGQNAHTIIFYRTYTQLIWLLYANPLPLSCLYDSGYFGSPLRIKPLTLVVLTLLHKQPGIDRIFFSYPHLFLSPLTHNKLEGTLSIYRGRILCDSLVPMPAISQRAMDGMIR